MISRPGIEKPKDTEKTLLCIIILAPGCFQMWFQDFDTDTWPQEKDHTLSQFQKKLRSVPRTERLYIWWRLPCVWYPLQAHFFMDSPLYMSAVISRIYSMAHFRTLPVIRFVGSFGSRPKVFTAFALMDIIPRLGKGAQIVFRMQSAKIYWISYSKKEEK